MTMSEREMTIKDLREWLEKRGLELRVKWHLGQWQVEVEDVCHVNEYGVTLDEALRLMMHDIDARILIQQRARQDAVLHTPEQVIVGHEGHLLNFCSDGTVEELDEDGNVIGPADPAVVASYRESRRFEFESTFGTLKLGPNARLVKGQP